MLKSSATTSSILTALKITFSAFNCRMRCFRVATSANGGPLVRTMTTLLISTKLSGCWSKSWYS